jgi:hypothetical protein
VNVAWLAAEVEEDHFYRFSVHWEHFFLLFSYLFLSLHGIFSIVFDLILALFSSLLTFFAFAPTFAEEDLLDMMLFCLLIVMRLRDQQQRDLFQKPVRNLK